MGVRQQHQCGSSNGHGEVPRNQYLRLSFDHEVFTIDKANATCPISGYTGVYDGEPHGATGSATGVNGETSAGSTSAPVHRRRGRHRKLVLRTRQRQLQRDNGTVAIVISQADATCSVSGYTGVYDGEPHGATGSATGVKGETLSRLDLGASFTNVPGGIANWSFSDRNYKDQSDAVEIVINAWTLKGFYQPVDMNGVWNTVKGGSTVPLKFEVFAGTTELTDTSDRDVHRHRSSLLDTGATDDIEADDDRRDLASVLGGQFIQNWQTPKTPGTCYRVTMKTTDGSSISALFKLK